MFYDLLPTNFHVKNQLLVTTKYDQDPDPGPDLHGSALVYLRMEVKSWIRIRIRINADPQQCMALTVFFSLHKVKYFLYFNKLAIFKGWLLYTKYDIICPIAQQHSYTPTPMRFGLGLFLMQPPVEDPLWYR